MMDCKDILAIEERALNAWPALQTVLVNGWALRFSGGFTKRANSANAIGPCADFEAVRQTVENLYRARGLPVIFRISPIATIDSDSVLERLGYSLFDPSLFMIAPLRKETDHASARVEAQPSESWLAGFAAANDVPESLRASHDAIVRAIMLPSAFVTIFEGETPVGFGLGVYERGMVGLFDIVVVPDARGRGIGRALTQTILSWGHSVGANRAYLNVRRSNAIALSLYASLGFKPAYEYHYRIPPDWAG